MPKSRDYDVRAFPHHPRVGSTARERGFWWFYSHPRAERHRARRNRERAVETLWSFRRRTGRAGPRLFK